MRGLYWCTRLMHLTILQSTAEIRVTTLYESTLTTMHGNMIAIKIKPNFQLLVESASPDMSLAAIVFMIVFTWLDCL